MRSLLCFALISASVSAAPSLSVSVAGLTNQQAILSISGADPSCTIQAFEDAAMTRPVHDTDETIFPGSTSCRRAGSITTGNTIQFTLGFRGVGTGADGHLYSRSLQLETPYWIEVSLASGAAQTIQLTTKDQQLGDSSPDYIPYSSDGFNGWGWPSIDYVNQGVTGSYIDPLHGRQLVRLTAPGDAPYFQNVVESFNVADLSGGNWTISANPMPSNPSGSTYSYSGAGGSGDALLLTPQWLPIPGGNHGYDSLTALDDLLLKLQGYGDALQACLTVDHGASCLGNIVNLAWPAGASASAPGSAASSSNFPTPLLDAWGSPDLTAVQFPNLAIKVWKAQGSGAVSLLAGTATMNASHNFGTEAQGQGATGCSGAMTITQDEHGNPLNPPLTGYICTLVDSQGDQVQKIWTPSNGQIWKINLSTGSNVANPNATPDYFSYASNEIQKCYYDLPNSAANCVALQTQQTIPGELAAAHPEIDTNYYGAWAYRGGSYPYFLFTAQPGQNSAYWSCVIDVTQVPGAAQVRSCHNSWSAYPLRWETSHSQGADFTNNGYVEAFQNFGMTSAVTKAAGEYTLSIVHVYSNGLAGTVQADNSLQSGFYDPNSCAALGVTNPQWLSEASNGAESCVVIDVAGEPVNTSPSASDLAAAYGSVPVGAKPTQAPSNPAYSFLQPMEEGDWIGDSYNTGQGERFLIAKKTFLPSGLIQLVLIRNPTAFGQNNGTQYHGPGWAPFMAPPLLPGNSCGGVYYSSIGQAFGTANWIEDNPGIWCGHQATWQSGGKETHVGVQAGYAGSGTLPDKLGGYYTGYGIRYGTTPGVWGNNGLQYAQQGQYPFAGSFAQIPTAFQQTHPGGDTGNAPPREQVWALDGRPYGPAGGSTYGLPLWRQPLTPVAGQSATYKIGLPQDSNGNALFENSGSGPKWTVNFDLKRRGIHAWSGFHFLRNVSGPNCQVNDATPWSFGIAMNAGECVPGSAAGDAFVSVPGANTSGYCWEGDGEINAPCLTVAGPEMGGYEQFGIDHWDPFGLAWRNLTMAFNGPGRTNDFANMHGKSTGDYGLTAAFWADGRRSDVFAVKLGDWPNGDSINRTQFEAVKYSFTPKTNVSVRARYGYSEYANGSNDPLFCSPNRMEECTTAVAGGQPYSFLSEPQQWQNCTANAPCTITLDAASQRVVNFRLDTSTDGGNTFTSGPLQVIATP